MRSPLSAEAAEAPTGHADPLAEAIRRADLVAIWAAIEALPRRQRDAILLREFGGLSYDELAAALAVTPPTVESLLFRARQRLRTQLQALVASVSGAPLLETLARGFAGGAPIAAKVAALGVGAAAITGGAVVAPDVLERSHRSLPPAQQPAPHRRLAVHTALPPAAPAAPAPAAAQPVTPAAPLAVHPVRHEAEHHVGGSAPEHPTSGDSTSGATSDGRDGASRETRDGGAAVVVQASTDSSTSGGERSGPDGGDGGGSSDIGVSGEGG